MAVAQDGTAHVTGAGHFVNVITLLGKTTAGTDRCEIVHIGAEQAGGFAVSTVLSGLDAMTSTVVKTHTTVAIGAAIFRSASATEPATTGHSVVITFTDDIRGSAGVSSYSGVDRAGTFASNSAEGAAAPSCTQTTGVGADTMVVDAGIIDDTPTIGADQTTVLNLVSTGGGTFTGFGSYQDGAAAGVMSWTGADDWAQCTVNIPAAGGAAAAPVRLRPRLLTGVGA